MLVLIYLIVTLVVMYIHAHGCYIKGINYPWKSDIILCFLWPIVLPFGIWMIVSSEKRP
jgi:hypothetical protein